MAQPAQWAISPLDLDAHLLVDAGDHPPGVLKARCAAVLPRTAATFDHPPGPRLCPLCWVASGRP
ncbi:MAG TPA: hypothetical protein VFN75_11555 [Pseudonocardiaceae bacterium]|nr:hypothetical protein [Pseudonocardiaceae bacterium]